MRRGKYGGVGAVASLLLALTAGAGVYRHVGAQIGSA